MPSYGEHPKVVQEQLGHADIKMTMDLYPYSADGMQGQAADRLDALDRRHEVEADATDSGHTA